MLVEWSVRSGWGRATMDLAPTIAGLAKPLLSTQQRLSIYIVISLRLYTPNPLAERTAYPAQAWAAKDEGSHRLWPADAVKGLGVHLKWLWQAASWGILRPSIQWSGPSISSAQEGVGRHGSLEPPRSKPLKGVVLP